MEVLEAILSALAASPAFRAIVKGFAIEVVAELLHRRATDPDFLAHSDATFVAISAAKTPEDLTRAQNALRSLLSG